ncbi:MULTISPECIES: SIR2 family NAD-dependent protein deacylase [unclassified Pyramidobacter]|uniref:SIR2 family NAD-dependent protein deacylase n=1 Tax=unclassified Pyramidobacter TaxID=2632171 RepID=UPI000EA0A007|nr:Sir2 silent information regulator family NAD-dependent deacetylase [Pyramidobacter sp. CG50-2]RKJ81299.1 Sir2 silent information regulator family NAD-dependent deacetylase [Pyramidobacter sp. CG50-2]
MSSKNWIEKYIPVSSAPAEVPREGIPKLRAALRDCPTVVIGAGAGLSAAAGFDYEGERFRKYFGDFAARCGFSDMYSGGFYRYETLEEQWAFWSRFIYVNRYMDAPKPTYRRLRALLRDKDYFVVTTNVDHCFQKARFDKERLFYTQGDYGLWQCSTPCHRLTYDNRETVRQMVLAQGFAIDAGGRLEPPSHEKPRMRVPSKLIPLCPKCGKPMAMNLRSDDAFVEDEGWRAAARRYEEFLKKHETGKVLYLELGVGSNTPGIIKYPFQIRTLRNPDAVYALVNERPQSVPEEIRARSIAVTADIGAALEALRGA